jgi:hypothetical protein
MRKDALAVALALVGVGWWGCKSGEGGGSGGAEPAAGAQRGGGGEQAAAVLDCDRLVPEGVRGRLGTGERTEDESYFDGHITCAWTGGGSVTELQVDYDCRQDQSGDPESEWARLLKEARSKDRFGAGPPADVSVGRGGVYGPHPGELAFIDGQTPCLVDVKVRFLDPRNPDAKSEMLKLASELEAALTLAAIGRP